MILCLLLLAFLPEAGAQGLIRGMTDRITSLANAGSGTGNDSLENRNFMEDSITVRNYFLDSSQYYVRDSSILDFTSRFPIPATHIYLGNTGAATRSLLFSTRLQAGWDPGFHAYDAYKWHLSRVRFFTTSKPLTELGYSLGSRAEQIIEILHTQNISPNWNASLQYRLINAPGTFRNQKTNHNNYLFTSWYQSTNRRYNNYFVILANRLNAGENGGIIGEEYLDNPIYARDRYTIPTRIGGEAAYGSSFFSSVINTGNKYTETNFLLRQQYDFGKKDSLVTDSTVIPLFFPRLRFEHTFRYGNYRYTFQDAPGPSNRPDSAYYHDRYGILFPSQADTTLLYRDRWKEFSNDFSIYQFPDARNLHQFIKLGAELQLLKGTFSSGSRSLHNIIGHGEYRNRTKNGLWDILAFGRLHLNGYNSGDYHAYINLQRLISARLGSLQLGFENVNRSPSFIYDPSSSFYFDAPKSFSKENTLHFFASIVQPRLQLRLGADYYFVTNYLYLTEFYRLQQEAAVFNVLRVHAAKTFALGRNFRWHAELHVQQKAGSAQVNFPLLYTRNRIGYEGKLGFRFLNIAIGTEIRYHTPYKADDFSPVLGQFFYQDTATISNLPQVDAYVHLRIRSFRAFFRVENLNTARFQEGFRFNNNNFAAPGYPTPGMVIRLGIYWDFVN